VQFRDPDDVVFAKVFLQEYQEARRAIGNAPSVLFSQKEPPLELKGVPNLKMSDTKGFVSFGTILFM
jgi:actin related protein 2/3 complex subunit 2